MEIVLEAPDKDAARVLELLRGIKRVKVESATCRCCNYLACWKSEVASSALAPRKQFKTPEQTQAKRRSSRRIGCSRSFGVLTANGVMPGAEAGFEALTELSTQHRT